MTEDLAVQAGSTEKVRPTPLNASGNLRIAVFPSSYFWNTSALSRVESVRDPSLFAALNQETPPMRLVILTTYAMSRLYREGR
jgi:hypothetical protein